MIREREYRDLIDEARLALVALIEVSGWSDKNEEPANLIKYTIPKLRQALEPFEDE